MKAEQFDELVVDGAGLILECFNAGGFPGRDYNAVFSQGSDWIQDALGAERAGRWRPSARTTNVLGVLAALVAAGPVGRWKPTGLEKLWINDLDRVLTERLAARRPW